jgi:hypothetical protein
LPVAMMMLSKSEAEAVMRASMKSKSTAGRSLASCVDLTYPANKEIHAVATARWRLGVAVALKGWRRGSNRRQPSWANEWVGL